jgi:hypothetical protein
MCMLGQYDNAMHTGLCEKWLRLPSRIYAIFNPLKFKPFCRSTCNFQRFYNVDTISEYAILGSNAYSGRARSRDGRLGQLPRAPKQKGHKNNGKKENECPGDTKRPSCMSVTPGSMDPALLLGPCTRRMREIHTFLGLR